MDVAYNQHASHVRRKNRSTTNLNRLSLAPLTSRLPLDDGTNVDDYHPEPLSAPPSYLQGKSAPSTPRLLSRSPGPFPRPGPHSASHSRGTSTPAALPKAKSTTHLHQPATSAHASRGSAQKRGKTGGVNGRDDNLASAEDTDWLLRAGALIYTETRESKGQAWLVSRASSVSLAGSDPERAGEEAQLAREREYFASRHASRRGSFNGDEPVYAASPSASRLGSRSQSRVGSRGGGLMTPSERRRSVDGYFGHNNHHPHPGQLEDEEDEDASYAAGPDFVSLDSKLEAVEVDTSYEDEAHVRRLVKDGGAGGGNWLGSVLGWGLFSVEENEEESDGEGDRETTGDDDLGEGEAVKYPTPSRRKSAARQVDALPLPAEERVPPPKEDEGGWQDAAWLLSVASKVLL